MHVCAFVCVCVSGGREGEEGRRRGGNYPIPIVFMSTRVRVSYAHEGKDF